MPLEPGLKLGPYEIMGRLGAGGMGEVYRARDTRLGREVALKILPADVSNDPARKARFEQEARAAAALNHPNITGLHDVGSEGGVSYIVTELIVGETLEAVIERGPIPARKLIEIAVQIADGMAAAHAARIAHRDLKPPNIMITTEGLVKILDFGLAKQEITAAATPDETVTAHHTTPGMILGTISYMSPEQARGKPADYRSDQFSFGIILHEMATGKKPFHKPETVQTLSAILTEDPPPIDRPIPATLKWAIERCLSKDPGDRYESTRDLYRELRHLRDHLSEASISQSGVAPAPARKRKIPLAIPVAFAAGLAVAGGISIMLSGPERPDQSTYRFTPFSFEPGGQFGAVWSPDGKAVAYAARMSLTEPFQMFVRYLDSPTPVQISHLKEEIEPIRWAPDGGRILFRTDRKPAGIWSISTVGGEPEPFQTNASFGPVDVSPDLKTVAGMRRGDQPKYGVWISSPPGAELKKYEPEPFATKVVYNTPRLKFSPDGRRILMFLHSDRHKEEAWLLPYPPDPSKPPKEVMIGLPSYGGTPDFAWMPDSRHILLGIRTSPDAPGQVWLADVESGARTAVTITTNDHSGLAVSPTGNRAIMLEASGSYDIVQMNLDRGTAEPLIATDRNELMPAWAAKQPIIVYVTDRNGPQEIWLHVEGRPDRPIVTGSNFPPDTTQWFMAPALSPDGDRVIYARVERAGGGRAWISSVSGGAPVPLTNDAKATEFTGSWSPDGSWFAYLAIRDGSKDLMKVKVSGQATPVLVKTRVRGEAPVWSPDGDWILAGDELISPDGQTVRKLPDLQTDTYAFAPNGKLLYGIETKDNKAELFSVDLTGASKKVIGSSPRRFRPGSNLHPGVRFSLSPDGKSIIYGASEFKTDLWMLEGFAPKTGLLARFGLR